MRLFTKIVAVTSLMVGTAVLAGGCGSTPSPIAIRPPDVSQKEVDHFTSAITGYLGPVEDLGSCYLITSTQAARDLVRPSGVWQMRASRGLRDDFQCQYGYTGSAYVSPRAAQLGILELTTARSHPPGEWFVRLPGTPWSIGYQASGEAQVSAPQVQRIVDDVVSNLRQDLGPVPPPGYPALSTVFDGNHVAPPGTVGGWPAQ